MERPPLFVFLYCVWVHVHVCVRDQAEGFIRDFISRQWEMFGPVSHLWLGDKSLSVTQLEQTPLHFFLVCLFVFFWSCVFSLHIQVTLGKKDTEVSLQVCLHSEQSSETQKCFLWACNYSEVTLFFLLIKQQAGSGVRWVHTRSASPALQIVVCCKIIKNSGKKATVPLFIVIYLTGYFFQISVCTTVSLLSITSDLNNNEIK